MKKFLFSFLFFISAPIIIASGASALNGNDFPHGRIIDDAVFRNKSSMTVQQIQTFLESKVNGGACDRWRPTYNQNYQPPYTCLFEFQQNPSTGQNNYGQFNPDGTPASVPGGQTAAQIIWQAAQDFNINPQVLIVLLQKEQGLVTDNWPWTIQYSKAAGYNCPDTAPCNPATADFSKQVRGAAWSFNFYIENLDRYWYGIGYNDILYNPNTACGRKTVYIENAATVALYLYTPYTPNQAALDNLYGTGDSCSAYGNRNFWRFYNDWFGSTHSAPNECDSQILEVVCVWSFIKDDGSQFLTSSKSEVDFISSTYPWVNEGVNFYASKAQSADTMPVYRLRLGSTHYFTIDSTEYANLVNTEGWTDEGVAFYVLPADSSTNASHRVYKLFNSSQGRYYWTSNAFKRTSFLNSGYIETEGSFNSLSNQVSVPLPPEDRVNIYRTRNNSGYFYTTSLIELENVVKNGTSYEGILATASPDQSGYPVYRLRNGDRYFYTTDVNEKNLATTNYGMVDEGIAFYLDDTTSPIYRVANNRNDFYLYTSNINELMKIVNTNFWRFEGYLRNKTTGTYPVLRFLNSQNGKHFYTINVYEASKITNTNWKFEKVAFVADKKTGSPIYRLRLNDRHFFTSDSNEKNTAINTYGFNDEGIAFYTSTSPTSNIVYRLQGRNNEYFYTISATERDLAISKYGYIDEGIGFYTLSD